MSSNYTKLVNPYGTVFSHKAVSEIVGISIHNLNYYVREGLITPIDNKSRGKGKVRYYSFQQLSFCKIIKKLAFQGVSINKIKKSKHNFNTIYKNQKGIGFENKLLVTDGKDLYIVDRENDNAFINTITKQYCFDFIFAIDLKREIDEVKEKAINRYGLPPMKIANL